MPSEPILVGDDPALDFLNTIAAPRGEPVESLVDGEAYVAWLAAVGLADPSEAGAARRRFSAAALDRAAAHARELREWFRHEIEHRDASRAWPTPRAAARLNDILATSDAHPMLARVDDGWGLREARSFERADQLLVPVARAIAELAVAGDWSLVRRCANPACTLWFYDRTKAHTRLYCSAAVCGNRAKVAAFRERQRKAAR